jgi:hypothetical protein
MQPQSTLRELQSALLSEYSDGMTTLSDGRQQTTLTVLGCGEPTFSGPFLSFLFPPSVV